MTKENVQGFFLVDKEKEWTSFQVVNKLKYAFKYRLGIKKIKIGHAGTLDPLATGLLIVCYGKMTKRILEFQGLEKEYTGQIKLGMTTPTYDMESEADAQYPIDHITDEDIQNAARELTGEIDQYPPKYSAKWVDGQRAYELARAGEEVKVRVQRVVVHEFEVNRTEVDVLEFKVRCSKGTYIRSLAHDLGKKLNSGASLLSLRRTAIGEHRVEDALKIAELVERFEELAV